MMLNRGPVLTRIVNCSTRAVVNITMRDSGFVCRDNARCALLQDRCYDLFVDLCGRKARVKFRLPVSDSEVKNTH